MKITPLIMISLVGLAPSIAKADDGLTPLAVNGDWMAFEHRQSIEDAPDICVAMSVPKYGFALRVDDTGDIEARLANDSWSLPANVSGDVSVKVNGHTYTYEIQSNTSSMVDAPLETDQLLALVKDMEIASSMQVIAGTAPPTTVPLDGSQAALTAFMTCSGIQNPTSNTGGSNPFSSSQ